jgi:Ca2+-binding RTX toxin-like protein
MVVAGQPQRARRPGVSASRPNCYSAVKESLMRSFFTNLVKSLARPAASARRSAQKRSFHPDMETLERRDVPSNVPVLANGILSMQAGDQGDYIHVKYDTRGTNNTVDDCIVVDWQRGNGAVDHYSYKLYGGYFNLAQLVKEIHVTGGDGNDKIVNDTALISVLRGGKGNDTITGGAAADLIEGGLGSDVLDGRGGNDQIYANKKGATAADMAVDILKGGDGDDWLFGSRGGVNFMYGGNDNDVLLGGDRALQNFMWGEDGDDYLGGGSADKWSDPAVFNIMVGGEGNDTLQAGWGSFDYFYAAETGFSGMGHYDVISTGQSKYASWTVEQQDAAGLWLPDQVVHNITIDPPATPAGPWTV